MECSQKFIQAGEEDLVTGSSATYSLKKMKKIGKPPTGRVNDPQILFTFIKDSEKCCLCKLNGKSLAFILHFSSQPHWYNCFTIQSAFIHSHTQTHTLIHTLMAATTLQGATHSSEVNDSTNSIRQI